jgi:hypothetical protein
LSAKELALAIHAVQPALERDYTALNLQLRAISMVNFRRGAYGMTSKDAARLYNAAAEQLQALEQTDLLAGLLFAP